MIDLSHVREKMREAFAFAETVGLTRQLVGRLDYLASYAGQRDGPPHRYDLTRCVLTPDFAPHSFAFTMERTGISARDGLAPFWFSGALVYQGPESPADGRAPSFCVSLATGDGWHVHT